MEASVEHTYDRDIVGIEFWTTHVCPETNEVIWHVPQPGSEPEDSADDADNGADDADKPEDEEDGEEEDTEPDNGTEAE